MTKIVDVHYLSRGGLDGETIRNSPIIVLTNTSEKRLETFCFSNFMNLLNNIQFIDQAIMTRRDTKNTIYRNVNDTLLGCKHSCHFDDNICILHENYQYNILSV